MTQLKIALLQLMPTETIGGNLQKGLEACRRAKKLGADLALFPEMWQIGYDIELMTPEYAIHTNNNFIQQHIALAKELKMAIAVTYLGKGKKKPTNALALIDARGNIILVYNKVHMCDFDEGTETKLEMGTEFKVAELEFSGEAVRIGAMICMDREFPESARTLMLKGAEIIITPNACSLSQCQIFGDVRIAAFRTRAFENVLGVAMTNYAAPQEDGHSCAFDASGKNIVIADESEQIIIASFDLGEMRNFRKEEENVRGPSRRRCEAYEI